MSTPEKTKETTVTTTTAEADHSWSERPNADKIPCPALLSFYNHGLLNPDENGTVDIADLDNVLASVGVNKTIRNALSKGADKSDGVRDCKFNLFALRDSSLDHSGSTGIRDPEVNPEMLEASLLKFSEDGRMYAKHFAEAANQAQKRDPGIKGTITQTVEFTALLEVFGREDESKGRYLTVEDVKSLWIDGKFPSDWQPRGTDAMGAGTLSLGVADMVMKRVFKAIGF